jgi:hypothetical protein
MQIAYRNRVYVGTANTEDRRYCGSQNRRGTLDQRFLPCFGCPVLQLASLTGSALARVGL